MAVVLGTNSGFVAIAPTADPTGGAVLTADSQSKVTKHTSPATAGKITEIGWWCDTATEAANYQLGLYAADGTVVPGEAGTLLFNTGDQAKGTTAGWKVVTGLNWTISPSTDYWLGQQLDNTTTTTQIDAESIGGSGRDALLTQTALTDPYGGGGLADTDGMVAIYAVWETAPTTTSSSTSTSTSTSTSSSSTTTSTSTSTTVTSSSTTSTTSSSTSTTSSTTSSTSSTTTSLPHTVIPLVEIQTKTPFADIRTETPIVDIHPNL